MDKLIITIVQKYNGELINKAAQSAGASGGTILIGKGTTESSILQLLGLGDTSKDITYHIVDFSIYPQVLNSIIKITENKKAHFGVLFSIDLNDFIKGGFLSQEKKCSAEEGEKIMPSTYELINVIVNKGYAEDAMEAARKAGAGGGTIIGARGTAKEDDAKFFGMKIVPEKDMLMILVPSDKKNEIVDAIKKLPCLSQAGSGIIFCTPANDFTILGKK